MTLNLASTYDHEVVQHTGQSIQKVSVMNNPPLQSEWLSDVQVAAYLGIRSRDTIWRWTREGRLPEPIKIGANSTRWRRSEIDARLKNGGEGAP